MNADCGLRICNSEGAAEFGRAFFLFHHQASKTQRKKRK